jgi:DNA invertase Pin-like site-specific DNA recombinase
MLIGYARVSTSDQKMDSQTQALKAVGCERIFSDTASGSLDERAGLKRALEALQPGDVLVVFKLDRMGRSLQHLVKTINDLGLRGIGFRSLNESLDTTSAGGRLILHIFAALAEFELEIIRMRTRAGLEAARLKGRVGGRPLKMESSKVQTAKRLLADPSVRVEDVCIGLNVSRATLYRHLKDLKSTLKHQPELHIEDSPKESK